MFSLITLGKILNLIVVFLITRNLSLILKYCMSGLIVFKIYHGMHAATIKNFHVSVIRRLQKPNSKSLRTSDNKCSLQLLKEKT